MTSGRRADPSSAGAGGAWGECGVLRQLRGRSRFPSRSGSSSGCARGCGWRSWSRAMTPFCGPRRCSARCAGKRLRHVQGGRPGHAAWVRCRQSAETGAREAEPRRWSGWTRTFWRA